MEKSQLEILAEIRTTISELQAKVDALEKLMAEAPVAAPAEEPAPAAEEPAPAEPETVVVAAPVEEPAPAEAPAEEPAPAVEDEALDIVDLIEPVDDLPADDLPEPAVEQPAPAAEPTPAPAVEPEPAPQPTPVVEPEPVPQPAPVEKKQRAPQSWMVDMPGAPVSNIISGISLNDRVLFINTLFKEDALLFQSTIGAFNAMGSLEEVLDYVDANFPDWNPASEVVYRLMMAVRRKLK